MGTWDHHGIYKSQLQLFLQHRLPVFLAVACCPAPSLSKITRAPKKREKTSSKTLGSCLFRLYLNIAYPYLYLTIHGLCQCAVNRAIAYAPFADMIWMESKLPDYAQAKEFADGVHAVWPEQKLAYNLSPSFNWKAAMEAKDQETYIQRLAELGYCWQFITLAGLHSTALISNAFAKDYAKRGMLAYGELVQEPEMANNIDVVKHQKWSGANYVDNMLKMVTGGVSSTSAMGKGVTEDQFH